MEYNELYVLLKSTEYEVRRYSGRYMFGKQCLGIIVPRGTSLLALGAELASVWMNLLADEVLSSEDFIDVLKNVLTDNFGYDTIVYFPQIQEEN